jgi:hypothetical protein
MWPDDDHPTHLFVCDEETSVPAVQRVDLGRPADANATTIVTGLLSCDPVRRTPWGTIIVAEENGADGGLYEPTFPQGVGKGFLGTQFLRNPSRPPVDYRRVPKTLPDPLWKLAEWRLAQGGVACVS